MVAIMGVGGWEMYSLSSALLKVQMCPYTSIHKEENRYVSTSYYVNNYHRHLSGAKKFVNNFDKLR